MNRRHFVCGVSAAVWRPASAGLRTPSCATAKEREGTGLFGAAWRWHFYAGLIVLPVMLWLAATGALYLYKPEIERAAYGSWTRVAPSGPPRSIAAMIAAVEQETSGRVTQVARPADPAESWRMRVAMANGVRRLAFVDPYRARLLGSTAGDGLMDTVRDLHSLTITGPVGNALVEIVAGWAIVLVVTGAILWWPRRGTPALALRGRSRQRLFWRDLHASVGLFAGGVILFLAVTGMPWSGVAGKQLNAWVKSSGYGRPPSPVPNPWKHKTAPGDEHAGHDHGGREGAATLPWSMQQVAPPVSSSGAQAVTADRAAEIAQWSGLSPPWTMTLPIAPKSPWLFSATTVRAEEAHAVYIDAATGRVLQDARYADFGAGARAIEWGIATHQGQQYGEANRLVMLFGCIAVWLLAITGIVMWWKRRRDGRLRAPPPADPRALRRVGVAMLALGILLPLTGLTMLAAWAGEAALRFSRR